MPGKKLKLRTEGSIIKVKKFYREWLSRDDWGAEPSRFPLEKTDGPVSRVFFHYRSGTERCYNSIECSATMRKIQENHFKRNMGDIAFNFLVASGGNVYEGRGFGYLPPPTLKKSGPPGNRLDIAFIGDWTESTLPYKIFQGGLDVIQKGVDKGYLNSNWEFHAVILEKKQRMEDKIKKKTKHKVARFEHADPFEESSEEYFKLEEFEKL